MADPNAKGPGRWLTLLVLLQVGETLLLWSLVLIGRGARETPSGQGCVASAPGRLGLSWRNHVWAKQKDYRFLTVCTVAAFSRSFPFWRTERRPPSPRRGRLPSGASSAEERHKWSVRLKRSRHTITLTPDKGGEVTVAIQPGAKIVRVAPGQTDLKGAATLQLSDLQSRRPRVEGSRQGVRRRCRSPFTAAGVSRP